MTLENITTDRIRQIERLLVDTGEKLHAIRLDAASSRITIKDAAARINCIGAEIEKAIYPEKHEGKQ